MPTLDELMVHCGVREYKERFYSFDSYPWKNEHLQWMMKWAEHRGGCNVLIMGDPGLGKSGLAIAALKERFRRGDKVWFEGDGKSILEDPHRAKKLNLDLLVLDDIIQFWHRGKADGLLELLKEHMNFIITATQWEGLSAKTLGVTLKGEIEKFEHLALKREEQPCPTSSR